MKQLSVVSLLETSLPIQNLSSLISRESSSVTRSNLLSRSRNKAGHKHFSYFKGPDVIVTEAGGVKGGISVESLKSGMTEEPIRVSPAYHDIQHPAQASA